MIGRLMIALPDVLECMNMNWSEMALALNDVVASSLDVPGLHFFDIPDVGEYIMDSAGWTSG